MIKALLALFGILCLSPGNDPNLLGNDWAKFHQSNIRDQWNVKVGDEISWSRKAGADSGSAGVYQRIGVLAPGKLLLKMEVRIDSHSLPGSGWWGDKRGGTGEYPAKIRLDYLDERERFPLIRKKAPSCVSACWFIREEGRVTFSWRGTTRSWMVRRSSRSSMT